MLNTLIGRSAPQENPVTAAPISIPVSITTLKQRIPGDRQLVTRDHVTVQHDKENGKPANALHAFTKSALFNLVSVGYIKCILCVYFESRIYDGKEAAATVH